MATSATSSSEHRRSFCPGDSGTSRGAGLARAFFRLVGLLALFLAVSCGSGGSKKKEPDPTVVPAPTRSAKVVLAKAQMPDGKGGYFSLGASDFVNGHYDTDIVAQGVPKDFQVQYEEDTAAKSGIFLTAPGLIWNVDPPTALTVTMTVRGTSQTLKRQVRPDNKLPVSLLAFANVFPPAFRERYDITISSLPGVPQPFSYTYTFNVKRSDADAVFSKVLPGDSGAKIVLGQDSQFNLGTVVPTVAGCSDCSISVSNVKVSASVKRFVELPSIPFPGDLRISYPRRFSALLVRQASSDLSAVVVGNNSQSVGLSVVVPATLSVIQPWCAKKVSPAGVCPLTRLGQSTPSFFRFANAVPMDVAQQSLGGTSGVASIALSGSADITVTRSGIVVEKKTVPLGSGAATSILDSPTLPSWVLDDLRNAVSSGAPEFSL